MHGREDARTDQEGTEKRERKGKNCEQNGPYLECVALFHHERAMEERGGRKPRHERGILNRVPEPPAAPAKSVVGPIRTHRDAEAQEDPGEQGPWPYPPCPGSVDAPLDQRRN